MSKIEEIAANGRDEDVPVRLGDLDLLWIKDADGGGSLAPMSHVGPDGKLDFSKCFKSNSYAHVRSDGTIVRHGKEIGRRSDLSVR